MSSETSPCFISQEKKPSPASPDHRVPSQSKAATRGWRRRTESRKAVCAGESEAIFFVTNALFYRIVIVHEVTAWSQTLPAYLSAAVSAAYCSGVSTFVATRGSSTETY